MKRSKYLLVGVFFAISSCSSFSPIAPVVEDIQIPIVDGQPLVVSTDPIVNFNNELRAQAIILSSEETKMVTSLKLTQPIGRWLPGENTTALTVLENNFNEFKDTFLVKPKDTTEYMTNAVKFANSQNFYARYYFDTEYYKKKNKVLLVKYDPQTTEFIVIHIDGRVSNYQMSNKITVPRYILVPDNL